MDSPARPSAAETLLGSRFVSGLLVALVAEIRAAGRGAKTRGASEGRRLEEALVDLSRVFYYAEGPGRLASLGDELVFDERYLRLQALRFGGRLEYRIKSEPGLAETSLPRLATFPSLERAVAESLEASAGAAFIAVEASRGPDGLPALRVARGRSPSAPAEEIRLGRGARPAGAIPVRRGKLPSRR
jgi:hypothetical protein